ncbi:ABC transporter ATP-binding protein [Acetivibrio cellulolyticus]|uniref:ABC transporter ATP-binding protein n=1 Tax=Acetivibrio cellulolyticus TaxID=35830 RepID=UPI0001E2FAF7|nr:ATP-binding cassette domain-containing protein [Acetivibrio cellulolyticus]
MIEVLDLTKSYGQIKAVRNLSFTVEKGEILGFLGPNGAGKSTTMNMITGYLPSTSGTVKVNGYDVSVDPREVKKRVGYLPEMPPLYTDLTVSEYLNFVSDLKKVDRKKRKSQVSDVMELVKISDVSKRLIKNLSKGYKQRVGLAQALIGNPEVLILDEPTVGLDPTQIIEVRKLIKALGKDHTIILSSHIMQEISAVCERIVIINKGQIVAVDTPENLTKSVEGSAMYSVKIDGPSNEVVKALKGIDGVNNVTENGKFEDAYEYLVEANKDVDLRKPIFFEMAKHGYPILEIKSVGMNLEEVFLKITSKDPNADLDKNKQENDEEITSEEVEEQDIPDEEKGDE